MGGLFGHVLIINIIDVSETSDCTVDSPVFFKYKYDTSFSYSSLSQLSIMKDARHVSLIGYVQWFFL